jgi:hypothetical protein
MEKKSQSAVIATILLILLVVAAISIIMAFVIPFIKEQLSGSKCLDIVDQFEIREGKYTCWNSTGRDSDGDGIPEPFLIIQIHLGDISNETDSFQLVVESAGNSNSYEISESNPDSLTMFPNFNSNLELPGENEERTYVIKTNVKPDSISVYPKIEGIECANAFYRIQDIDTCFEPII